MNQLMRGGAASTLEGALEMAARIEGVPIGQAQQEAAAKAADEARRLKLASAKAAGTPRTSGAPARELPPDHSGKSTLDLLNAAYDEMVGVH
jgi:hypothetical protein